MRSRISLTAGCWFSAPSITMAPVAPASVWGWASIWIWGWYQYSPEGSLYGKATLYWKGWSGPGLITVLSTWSWGVTRAGIRHGRYRGKLAGGDCGRLYGHRWAQHPSLIRSYQWSPVGWGAFELTADRTTDLATDLAADLEGLRRVGREWALPGRMAAALRVLCEGNSRSGDEQEYGRCCDSRRKVHMSSHVAEV